MSDCDSPSPDTGTPRWVKVSALLSLALVVVLIVLHLTGNSFGGHTP